MEEQIDVAEQWQNLCAQTSTEFAGLEAKFEFLERTSITEPHAVIDWCNATLKESQSINYTEGIASSLAIKGFAHYMLSNHEKALPLLAEALTLIEPLSLLELECKITRAIAGVHISLGNLSKVLEYGQRTLALVKETGNKREEAWVLHGFGVGFEEIGQLEQALQYYEDSLELFRTLDLAVDTDRTLIGIGRALTGIGGIHQKKGEFEEAFPFHEESLVYFKAGNNKIGEARALNDLGAVALHRGEIEDALQLHTESLNIRKEIKNRQSQSTSLHNLGKVYISSGQYEQAISHLREALEIAEEVKAKTRILLIHLTLSEAYEGAGDLQNALNHHRLYNQLKDEVFNEELNAKTSNMEAAFEIERAEKEAEITRLTNVELYTKNEQLEKLLKDLQAAQSQLIQSEKLVSLGHLTAGIAHELKNPLNFVNNFAALAVELMEELEEALRVGSEMYKDGVPAEVQDLLDTLRFNTLKVNEHGQRADRIVRSMLEHAGGRPGVKEVIHLNDLLKDYVKLAYHGMRATDRTYKVTIEQLFTNDDTTIEAVSQDLGRVFLNILNNAFYTTRKKKEQNPAGYAPHVKVQTINTGSHISIKIEDNGEGIAEEDQKRIFEPFFTSKPSGAGTGLGLFLSYEIIVQGHGGELLVESVSGKGSIFTINLALLRPGAGMS